MITDLPLEILLYILSYVGYINPLRLVCRLWGDILPPSKTSHQEYIHILRSGYGNLYVWMRRQGLRIIPEFVLPSALRGNVLNYLDSHTKIQGARALCRYSVGKKDILSLYQHKVIRVPQFLWLISPYRRYPLGESTDKRLPKSSLPPGHGTNLPGTIFCQGCKCWQFDENIVSCSCGTTRCLRCLYIADNHWDYTCKKCGKPPHRCASCNRKRRTIKEEICNTCYPSLFN